MEVLISFISFYIGFYKVFVGFWIRTSTKRALEIQVHLLRVPQVPYYPEENLGDNFRSRAVASREAGLCKGT